jgi:hypothetical protein
MRRLKQVDRDENGAMLVFFAVVLILLLVAAGFAVDAGAMYQERRQLRNGADAAALAIAEECLEGAACTGAAAMPTAEAYADLNADDGRSGVDSVVIDSAPSDPLYDLTVRVVTSSERGDGSPGFDFSFMRVVGIDSTTVRGDATSATGLAGSGDTVPVIFDVCEWLDAFGGVWPTETDFPSGLIKLYTHSTDLPDEETTCDEFQPAHQDAPGAFGYLEADDCIAEIVAGTTGNKGGNNLGNANCTPEQLEDLLIPGPALIPIFTGIEGQGQVTYTVGGFGMLETDSYCFSNSYRYPKTMSCKEICEGPDIPPNARCLVGRFTDGLLQTGEFGGGFDFGVTLVRLID